MSLLDRPAISRDVAFWGALVASVSATHTVNQVVFALFTWFFVALEIHETYTYFKKRKQLRKELAEARERMTTKPWQKPHEPR